ncbi:MAG: hypothetical protein JO181_12830 [Solirubrobacterales bacterium]|nr:hypothetical protein [Solirubrobacterales bacterium]
MKPWVGHYVGAVGVSTRSDGDRSYRAVPTGEACGRFVSQCQTVSPAAQDQQRVGARAEKVERANGLAIALEAAHVRQALAGDDRF